MQELAAQQLATPSPVLEVVVGLSVLVFLIALHGAALRNINRRFNAVWVTVTPQTAHWRVNLILTVVIAALALLHLAETFLLSLPIVWLGMLDTMRDSYFFVFESYTTLGAGSVTLPDEWRLFGPIIGMSGLFTFGLTGSVLVNVMDQFGRLDRSQASALDRSQAAARDGRAESEAKRAEPHL